VNVYFNSSNATKLYNSRYVGDVRTDTNILNISSLSNITYISTSNQVLEISGLDIARTTKVGHTTFADSNSYQLIKTDDSLGFQMNADLFLQSNLIVSKNLANEGNFFTHNLNLYKNTGLTGAGTVNQVDYSFYINEHNQLELIKFEKMNIAPGQYTYNMYRMATFGKDPNSQSGNINNYTVVNEFNGNILNTSAVTSGFVNGISTISWYLNDDNSRIYYNSSNVGINTSSPQHWLDVKGDICTEDIYVMSNIGIGTSNPEAPLHVVGNSFFEGDIIPGGSGIYNLGSPEHRFGVVYISANTIDLGGTQIKTNTETGYVNFTDINSNPVSVSSTELIIENANTSFVIKIQDNQ
jgi:hypothetical protein